MSWSNYDDAITQLRDAGLLVTSIDVTGKMVRCKVEGDREKRGWYCLHEFRPTSGDMLIVGAYGIWQGSSNNARKIELGDAVKLSTEEKSALKARLADDRKRADAARKGEASRAAIRAQSVWRKCGLTGENDYLTRKYVKAYGIRFTPQGAIVVPMIDNSDRAQGLQFILSKTAHAARIKKTGRDKEYWPKGLAKQGCYHLMGGTPSSVLLIAEGYATGATLHEATELPVAIAFDAGNITPVAQALHKRYPTIKILICADDDWLQKCKHCKKYTLVGEPFCSHCKQDHLAINAGVQHAHEAAFAVGGAVVIPKFITERPTDKKGPTDFNDLHVLDGLHLVRSQVEAKLDELKWRVNTPPARVESQPGGGVGDGRRAAVSMMSLDAAMDRFIYIDDNTGDFVFDTWTHEVCKFTKLLKILPAKTRTDDVKDHPVWRSRAVYIDQIGFDPGGDDANIVCNRWGGWPTKPRQGSCELLLDLLLYLCNGERDGEALFEWVIKWLAYPIQHPGAKMHSAIVVHGPQGTGKSRFFEAYAKIFGDYSMVLNQGAIEDKFNSDWCERKLFILADEIVARADMYHLKNQLKNFITGEWVRVNPKNVAAHRERNHMNIVFTSNEKQPVVLENDDRRHCVIWTPQKLDEAFYDQVNEEVENGGIEALHHYLLNVDLGNFKPWTKPPMTLAKRELIDISLGSEDRFILEWMSGDVVLDDDMGSLPFCPCGSDDLYAAYLKWCRINGETKPRPQNQFMGAISKRPGWDRSHRDRYTNTHYTGEKKRQRMIMPSAADLQSRAVTAYCGDYRQPENKTIAQWMTDCFFTFRAALGGKA